MPSPVIKLIDATSPDAIKIWADKIYAAIVDLQAAVNTLEIEIEAIKARLEILEP